MTLAVEQQHDSAHSTAAAAANTQGADQAGLEAAFAEFGKKIDDRREDDAPARQSQAVDDLAPNGQSATDADTGTPSTPDAATAADGDKATPQDIWANATPEQRAAFQAASHWEHKYRSDLGRETAHQRRISELLSEVSALKAQPTTTTTAAPASGEQPKAPNAAIAQRLRESPKLKKALEEYPEVAEPLVEALESIAGDVSTLTTAHREQATKTEEQHLEDVHPDWRNLAGTEDFRNWVASKPRAVQDIATRNGDKIVDAEEAIDLVTQFKHHLVVSGKAQPKPNAGEQPRQQQPSTPAPTNQDVRARQLDSARGGAPRSAAAVSGAPDDVEGAFNYFAAKKQRR